MFLGKLYFPVFTTTDQAPILYLLLRKLKLLRSALFINSLMQATAEQCVIVTILIKFAYFSQDNTKFFN